MAETVTPREILEAAKAEQSRREKDWANKMIARREQAAPKEAEPTQKLAGRLEDGSVAQISPEFAGTEVPVKLEFRRAPEPGTLLYFEKPAEMTPEKGKIGFQKFFRTEDPGRGVPKQEGTVYLRAESVQPEDAEALKAEARSMNEYLTEETLTQLGLAETEAQPETERMPAAA